MRENRSLFPGRGRVYRSAIKSNADLTQQTYDIVQRLEDAKDEQVLIGSLAVLFLLAFVGLLLYYRRAVLAHDH